MKRFTKAERINAVIETWGWCKLAYEFAKMVDSTLPASDTALLLKREWETGMEERFRQLTQYILNK